MGDALCGPSNALQSFQKHASVDRTLQQDRLTLRQGPSQGFRSAPGANVGVLDPEFDAFQAGFSGETPQPAVRQPFIPPIANGINTSFPPSAGQPSWATDFQRLNISSPPPHLQVSKQPSAHQVMPVANAASWHQDFLKSMPTSANSPGMAAQPGSSFGGLTGYYPAFQPAPRFESQYAGQEASKERTMSPGFDDAAFERAFEAAHADSLESSSPPVEDAQQQHARMAEGRIPEEASPLMRLTWERQPVTYLVVKIWNAFGLSTEGAPFRQDTAQNAAAFLSELERLQNEGRLTDEGEILRTRKILSRILQLDDVPDDGQYRFTSRARELLDKVEGRVEMTMNDSSQLEELPMDPGLAQEAEAVHNISQEHIEEQQEKAQDPGHDDEELARTAAQLLDSVSDNTSKKFQESNFLALMRKLRDREVRVEGDKMVETSQTAGNNLNIVENHEDFTHVASNGDTEARADSFERFT